jgi:MFS family permease
VRVSAQGDIGDSTDKAGLGLDLLNGLVASAQTGFGAFIAVYLTSQAWTQVQIGEALSFGTAVAMVSQLPAGALVDAMPSKRLAVGLGGAAIAASAALFAAWPHPLAVLAAEVLHGFASCVIVPAIAALSLALVGQAGLGERLGRNARFASLGSAASAALLGWLGTYVSGTAVFWLTAAMMLLGLASLLLIPGGVREPATAPAARGERGSLSALLDRRLLTFATAIALFSFANAAMLPLVAGDLTSTAGSAANLVIAACIIAPQILVAVLSPLVGRSATAWGRRPLLLIGFAALPVRGALLAAVGTNQALIVTVQAIDGISAAAVGVLLPLVAADLTRGSKRYNLCLGLLGLASGLGAVFSTTIAGLVADKFGTDAALLALAAVGAVGVATLIALPETGPRTATRVWVSAERS